MPKTDSSPARDGFACTQDNLPRGNGCRRPIARFPGIRKSAASSSPRVANPQVKHMVGVSDPDRPGPARVEVPTGEGRARSLGSGAAPRVGKSPGSGGRFLRSDVDKDHEPALKDHVTGSSGSPDEQAAAPDDRGSDGGLMDEIDRLLAQPSADERASALRGAEARTDVALGLGGSGQLDRRRLG